MRSLCAVPREWPPLAIIKEKPTQVAQSQTRLKQVSSSSSRPTLSNSLTIL